MKKIIAKAIFGILSFCIAFGMSIPVAFANFIWISGQLDKRNIQKVVRLHENEIRHCYETALLKDKTLHGKIETSFIILNTGIVEKAEIKESTLNDPELEQCVIEHIENLVFPAIHSWGEKTRTRVDYSFTFVSNYKPPKNLERVRVILNEDDMIIKYEEMPPSSPEN